MGWYIVITEEMREALGLAGNDLMVYAIIHGYSQKEEGCYFGSAASLGDRCGIHRDTVLRILKRLTEAGYIKKTEIYRNGVRYCAYMTCDELSESTTKSRRGYDEMSPNNKEDNKDASINTCSLSNAHAKESKKSSFVKPTLDEVKAYCDERLNNIDPQQFIDFYESNGWRVGSNPMKDWKAAIRTWEARRKNEPKNPSTPRRRESPLESAMRAYDRYFGTDFHKQNYGND